MGYMGSFFEFGWSGERWKFGIEETVLSALNLIQLFEVIIKYFRGL